MSEVQVGHRVIVELWEDLDRAKRPFEGRVIAKGGVGTKTRGSADVAIEGLGILRLPLDEIRLAPEPLSALQVDKLLRNRWAAFTDDDLKALGDAIEDGSWSTHDRPVIAELSDELERRRSA